MNTSGGGSRTTQKGNQDNGGSKKAQGSNAVSASLVKYDTPVLASNARGRSSQQQQSLGKTSKRQQHQQQLPPVDTKQTSSQTEDILNSILPPREWTADGQLWVQYVSSTPATRLDVINLQEQLDMRLQQRQARETGICPIREELYAQCFDELIRQVTINCAERGLLLLRVRDEIRMTIAAYQTLYESSIAFGMRKALMAEQRRAHLKEKLEQLRSEKSDLQQQVESLRQKLDQMQQDEERKAKQEEDEHQTEVQRLTDINNQLKGQLEDLLAAPTKK
eukprot:gb/GECG01007290.1/.p1 GENE.gb/GECG01007290.1/~~gb/GECG01007290.1/.p1  ORF type:complete len:278 (+),score=56.94 gb/GECG01007290.1/:1-834(+)